MYRLIRKDVLGELFGHLDLAVDLIVVVHYQ